MSLNYSCHEPSVSLPEQVPLSLSSSSQKCKNHLAVEITAEDGDCLSLGMLARITEMIIGVLASTVLHN